MATYLLLFLLVFLVSYGFNFVTLRLGLELTNLNPALLQIAAMAAYSVAFFLIGRRVLAEKVRPGYRSRPSVPSSGSSRDAIDQRPTGL